MSVRQLEVRRAIVHRRTDDPSALDRSEESRAELQTVGRSSLARLLRISPSTLDRMRADGNFAVEPIAMFGRLHWSREAVARWLGGHPSMPDGDYSLLTLHDVARRLAVSRATAYRLRNTTELVVIGICVGGETRYPLCRVKNIVFAN